MPKDQDPLTTAQALAALCRRRGLVCLCALVVAASAFAFGLLRDQRFSATALLRFDQQPPSAAQIDALASGRRSVPPAALSNSEATLRAPVIAATAASLHLDRSAVEEGVDSKEGSTFEEVEVEATGSTGPAAAALANSYARRYVAFQNARTEHLLASGLQKSDRLRRAAGDPGSFGPAAKALRTIARDHYGQVAIASSASVPSSPSSPDLVRNALIGLAIGLLLGAAVALGLESANPTAGAGNRGSRRVGGWDGRPVDA